MSPAEIAASLKRIVNEAGSTSKDILAGATVRALGAAVVLLAFIVAEQERRLRVLEPCRGGEPHVWAETLSGGMRCRACDIVRGP